MDEFQEETATMGKLLYKSKNAHYNTLYYRKLVHVKRLANQLIAACRQRRSLSPLAESLQRQCLAAYTALSSLVPLGHHLPLAIAGMAMVAKVYTLSHIVTSTAGITTDIGEVVVIDQGTPSGQRRGNKGRDSGGDSEEDISDIFNKF